MQVGSEIGHQEERYLDAQRLFRPLTVLSLLSHGATGKDTEVKYDSSRARRERRDLWISATRRRAEDTDVKYNSLTARQKSWEVWSGRVSKGGPLTGKLKLIGDVKNQVPMIVDASLRLRKQRMETHGTPVYSQIIVIVRVRKLSYRQAVRCHGLAIDCIPIAVNRYHPLRDLIRT